VRVPATSGAGARLEHRICGADVNPYLALAAILGGIAHGLENKLSSGPALTDGDGSDGERLHHDWTSALDEFEGSALARSIYSDEYVRVYTACRRAEVAKLATMISDAEYKTYLHKL
jgi:glutamine synthetase